MSLKGFPENDNLLQSCSIYYTFVKFRKYSSKELVVLVSSILQFPGDEVYIYIHTRNIEKILFMICAKLRIKLSVVYFENFAMKSIPY